MAVTSPVKSASDCPVRPTRSPAPSATTAGGTGGVAYASSHWVGWFSFAATRTDTSRASGGTARPFTCTATDRVATALTAHHPRSCRTTYAHDAPPTSG